MFIYFVYGWHKKLCTELGSSRSMHIYILPLGVILCNDIKFYIHVLVKY